MESLFEGGCGLLRRWSPRSRRCLPSRSRTGQGLCEARQTREEERKRSRRAIWSAAVCRRFSTMRGGHVPRKAVLKHRTPDASRCRERSRPSNSVRCAHLSGPQVEAFARSRGSACFETIIVNQGLADLGPPRIKVHGTTLVCGACGRGDACLGQSPLRDPGLHQNCPGRIRDSRRCRLRCSMS